MLLLQGAVSQLTSPRAGSTVRRSGSTDLLHSDSDSALFVYLSFLLSLELLEAPGDNTTKNSMSAVHSFLCGHRAFNQRAPKRRMHLLWTTIVNAIRWYAENLIQEEEDVSSKSAISIPLDRIRHSSSDNK